MKKYLYVAKCGEFVKIGIAKVPRQRIKVLGIDATKRPKLTARPALIHATLGTSQEEKLIHSRLIGFNVTGEWYTLDCLRSEVVAELLSRPKDLGPDAPINWKGHLTITLPKSLIRTSRVVARTHHLSLSAWMASLVRDYFQRVEKALR